MFEAEACARRASLPTVPEADARHDQDSDAGACVLDQPKLTWAVDLGDELRAMSTFDLWFGLSQGDISGQAKVWRVGREAWTPAGEVPELACALVDVPVEPARETIDYVARVPSFGAEPELVEPGQEARASADDEVAREPSDQMAGELESADLTPSEPVTHVISVRPEQQLPPVRRSRPARAALLMLAATLGGALIAALTGESAPAAAATPALAAQIDLGSATMAANQLQAQAEERAREIKRLVVERAGRAKKSWSPTPAGQQRRRQR